MLRGAEQIIDVARMAQGSPAACLDALQWLKDFCDAVDNGWHGALHPSHSTGNTTHMVFSYVAACALLHTRTPTLH